MAWDRLIGRENLVGTLIPARGGRDHEASESGLSSISEVGGTVRITVRWARRAAVQEGERHEVTMSWYVNPSRIEPSVQPDGSISISLAHVGVLIFVLPDAAS